MGKNYSQKLKIENVGQKLFEKIKPAQNQRKNVKKSTFTSKTLIFRRACGAKFPENGQKLLAKSQFFLAKGSKIICQISEFENLGQKLFFGMVNNYLQMGKN